MKKLLRPLFVGFLLILGGCGGEKNQIPEKYLGKYISDYHVGNERGEGYAILSKKGSKYFIEMDLKHFNKYESDYENGEYKYEEEMYSDRNLKFEGKIDKIGYREYGELGIDPKYAKDFYRITFKDVKTSGKDGDSLKYDSVIYIIGEKKLKTENEDRGDWYYWKNSFSYEKEPVSILSVNGSRFKKIIKE